MALLRSLAVAPDRRGRRLAHDLWRRILDRARALELERLYLLTTTAEPLFARWGFARIARDVVPDPDSRDGGVRGPLSQHGGGDGEGSGRRSGSAGFVVGLGAFLVDPAPHLRAIWLRAEL